MSWVQKLYETYDPICKTFDEKPWPVAHFVKNAHIEIVLDALGNIKRDRVRLLEGEEAATLIPASESSAGRAGSKIAPHPLCEEMSYCALDLPNGSKEKQEAFFEQLNNWKHASGGHPKLNAIYSYLKKACLWEDISREVVFPLKFKSKSGQSSQIKPEKTFIRWRVEENNNPASGTWEDESLMCSWRKFDEMVNSITGFCSVVGGNGRVARNHPKFLRNAADGAKLISSNDSGGYTFKGKFLEADEAADVSFEVTQKAHNALRWLISKQGNRNGDQVIVAWAVSGESIPKPLEGIPFDFDDLEEVEITNNATDDLNNLDLAVDVGQSFARQLNQYMKGYKIKLQHDESVVIMGLDSATPGRMGIIYYREYFAHEYIDTITRWHNDFAWFQRVTKELSQKKGKAKAIVTWPVCAPSLWEIVNTVYGDVIKSNDSLKKSITERLLPCIVDSKRFPVDIVNVAIKRASNPLSGKKWEWEKCLGVACALYRGFYKRHSDKNKRRDYSMALDITCTSRDYLYGRLLAVAESLEGYSLYLAGEKRLPTAIRMMQRFADRPFSTWRTIELALQPYIQRLQNNRGGFVAKRVSLIDEIMELFQNEEFSCDQALSGEFLLGFHLQRLELRKTKEEKETVEQETTEEGEE